MTKALVRVLDFEGTGLDEAARVVEVGHCDFDASTHQVLGGSSYLCGVEHMPPDARAIHHIRLEEVRGLAPYDRWCLYEQAARDGVVAFAAHSAEYEGRFLVGSIPLVCTYKAALRVWPDAPSHSVFGLLYWLEDMGLVQFDRGQAYPPHRALPDAYATAVLLGAIYRQGYQGRDLIQWTMEPKVLPTCPIGAWRGRKWAEIEWSFLDWIVRKISDNPDLVWNASLEMDRREALEQGEHD